MACSREGCACTIVQAMADAFEDGVCNKCSHSQVWHSTMKPKEDVPDYMSSDFLSVAQEIDKQRTNQLDPVTRKRKKQQMQREEDRKQPKSLHARMEANRAAGLTQSIPTHNIGHKLLAKMGYKSGQALGKQERRGIVEPIGIDTTVGKAGLGRSSFLIEKQKEKDKAQQKRTDDTLKMFRASQKAKLDLKKKANDLKRARASCQSLDTETGVDDNPLWLKPLQEQQEKEGKITDEYPSYSHNPLSEEVLSLDKVLAELTHVLGYMRDVHRYCLYCEIQYKSKEDLTAQCPGMHEEAHDEVDGVGDYDY